MDGLKSFVLKEMTPTILNQLIEERSGGPKQRAEEQRLKDLKTIKSRKNENGLDPLQILPLVVWEQVLKYLLEPQDLLHAYNTCPLFRSILEPRKVGDILFPLVLQVGVFKYEVLYADDYYDEDDDEEVIHSNVIPFHILRPVSRSLRRAVDAIHLTAIETQNISSDTYIDNPYDDVITLNLDDGSHLDLLSRLTAYFAPEDGSLALKKLPIRALKLHLGIDDQDLESLSPALISFLDCVGDQLSSFTGVVDHLDYGRDQTMAYFVLRDWLGRMPNLRSLILAGLTGPFSLPRYLPMPTFASLEHVEYLRLEFDFWGREGPLEPSLVEAILSQAKRVKILTLNVNEGLADRSPEFSRILQSLPLEEFSLKFWDTSKKTKKAEIDLDPFFNFEWNLRKLEMVVSNTGPSRSSLFRLINRFQGLEEVTLEYHEESGGNGGDGNRDPQVFLQLPKLKRFELKVKVFKDSEHLDLDCLSIDFLIPCPGLERITLHHDLTKEVCDRYFSEGQGGGKGKEFVQFQGGFVDSQKSNVWRVFPYLKKVLVVGKDEVGKFRTWSLKKCEFMRS